MQLDKDLQSLQEMRDLVSKAKKAQLEFRSYDQARVDRICSAMAEAGFSQSARLARMACDETGFGNAEDKRKKNEFATQRVWESIKNLKSVGVISHDKERKIIEIAEPMGVVAALIPSTNPTSTMMFKAIISLKGRNAIVASPHPKSVKCTMEAAQVISQAAEAAGAPPGLIQCLSIPTIESTNALMKQKDVAVILATGSGAMVKAAYSSGKPAYGVGPGNVPAYIEKSANIKKAVSDIVAGKTFDNGVLCSTEASVIVDSPVKGTVVEEFKKHGCFFLEGEDKTRLARLMFDPQGNLNPDIVGKPASFIAGKAGITVPGSAKALIVELQGVGRLHPLSHEKLSPVLSFYTVDNWREGCERCIELLEFGGLGHTMVIHSTDEDIVMKFALEKPAFRILVNTVGALGAVGYTNELLPSFTLGPGTFGGSIISENVSAKHLFNVKRLAFETRPVNSPQGNLQNAQATRPRDAEEKAPPPPSREAQKPAREVVKTSWIEEIEERIRLKGAAGSPPPQKEKQPAENRDSSKKGDTLGSGISEDEADRIIKEFSQR